MLERGSMAPHYEGGKLRAAYWRRESRTPNGGRRATQPGQRDLWVGEEPEKRAIFLEKENCEEGTGEIF